MKRLLIAALLIAASFTASAWGRIGHPTVVEIAKRHLTAKAQENISKYMPYDIAKDAQWMDKNRNKKSKWPYSNDWHSFYYDSKLRHDPNMKIRHGDALRALDLATRNLAIYEELSDSAVIYNLRAVLHIVGDIHCPAHCKLIGGRDGGKNQGVYLNGAYVKSFHRVYDDMPKYLYGRDKNPAVLAEELDIYSKGQIKKVCKGNHHDWAQDCINRTHIIHKWNPNDGTAELRDDTIERSRELIDIQLRHAGYRLAHLLNQYFDKK